MAHQGVIVRKQNDIQQDTIKAVQTIIRNISFGSITLLIQDGKVFQIDKKEKIRLK